MKNLLRDAWRSLSGAAKNPVEVAPDSNPASTAVDAAFKLALAAHQEGRFAEAREGYLQILGQHPDHAPAMHFLGVALNQTGDPVQAERMIRRSIELQPLPEYFSNLAMVLAATARIDESIVAQQEAMRRVSPDNESPALKLGDLLVKAGRFEEAAAVYQGVLGHLPKQVHACCGLAGALSSLGRNAEAVEIYRRALQLQPDDPDILSNIGILLVAQGKFDEAAAVLLGALRVRPDAAGLHASYGRLMQETGRLTEAETAYRRAIELRPDHADAYNNLGVLLKAGGRLEEAESALGMAVEVRPDFVLALNNLGLLLEAQERFAEAEEVLQRALSLSVSAETCFNLANVYSKTKRNTEAEGAYRRALALTPDYPEACANLGALLHAHGRFDDAENLFRRALELQPGSATALYNLGGLLLDLRRYEEAEEHLVRSLELQPCLAEAHNRLGTLYKETARFDAAEAAYRRGLDLRPESSGLLTNLALLLHESGRLIEAEAAYHEALARDPAQDFARYNFSLLLLSQGRFREGWEGYEYRWGMKGFNVLRHQESHQLWRGEPLTGESMVVWQEQGVGDVILYAGLIPDLLALGPRLVVECEARLVPLLERSFPGAKVVMRADQVRQAARDAKWQSPLGSLCRYLRNEPAEFRWRGPYLSPDKERVAEFCKRYRGSGSGPVIGISWKSSNHKVGVRKSLPLSSWAPLLGMPGAIFVNLQYGDCSAELAQIERDFGIRVLDDGAVDPMRDLDGFAAQVAAMDLVVSASNSTVHFAGALGVPAWVLLPEGDALLWYWFRNSEHCLWYPGVRFFRQTSPGDWTGPLGKVREELAAFIQEFPQRGTGNGTGKGAGDD